MTNVITIKDLVIDFYEFYTMIFLTSNHPPVCSMMIVTLGYLIDNSTVISVSFVFSSNVSNIVPSRNRKNRRYVLSLLK